MKKLLFLFAALCCTVVAKAQTCPPNDQLWYTSSDGQVVMPNRFNFNVKITSNTYENGKGVITFDGELTSIGQSAFYTTKIASVSIPASLKKIGTSAFSICDDLKTLVIPSNSQLQEIGNDAFNVANIEGELTIPASVTIIGNNAFDRCPLTKVYMSTEDLHRMGRRIFPETTLVLVAPQLYERYTSYFGNDFKIEVPLKEWQEYTLNQIDAARRTINALSDEDNADLATVINIIKNAKVFDETLDAYYHSFVLIDRQKAFEEKVKTVLASMASRQDGPAVEIVGNNGQTFRLYNIKNVRYIKENKK